jgi:hypothetical protein
LSKDIGFSPQLDGDFRAEPDRVQLKGRPARLMSKALDVKTASASLSPK